MISFILASTAYGPLLINRHDYNTTSNGAKYGVGIDLLDTGTYAEQDVNVLKFVLGLRRQYYGDGVVALDGGANIGVHTVEWAKHMTGWGSVLAFEAQERIYYALCGNLILQNCFNAQALWMALGKTEGYIQFPEPDYNMPASFGSFELKKRNNNEFIGQSLDYSKPTRQVTVTTIDSVSPVYRRVDLIKLDIEGMEIEALLGAQNTLAKHTPVVFVEVIKAGVADIQTFLEALGYKTFSGGMNMLAVHSDDPCLKHFQDAPKP